MLVWKGRVAPAGIWGDRPALYFPLPLWAQAPFRKPGGPIPVRCVLRFELGDDFARWAGREVFVVGVCGKEKRDRLRALKVLFAVPAG